MVVIVVALVVFSHSVLATPWVAAVVTIIAVVTARVAAIEASTRVFFQHVMSKIDVFSSVISHVVSTRIPAVLVRAVLILTGSFCILPFVPHVVATGTSATFFPALFLVGSGGFICELFDHCCNVRIDTATAT